MGHSLFRILEFFRWPIVCYAGFSYGSYLIWFNVLNATASLVLSDSPYNFSSSAVGLSYLSCCVGVVVGAIVAGTLSDLSIIKLTRRNCGTMEAEYRLWPLSACIIMVPASLVLWGVGASNGVNWMVLMVAMGCLAATGVLGLTLSINYVIDSYPKVSQEAIVTVILIRNTMSFVVSYG